MASVFIQQRSTIIKAGIHHKRSRDRNFPSGFSLNKPAWGCSQKFRLQFSSPLSAIAVLIFLVQKVPFFRNPPVCIGRWTWQVEWKHKTESPGDIWSVVQQRLIYHLPAASPPYHTSKSIKTSGSCRSIIVSRSTPELRLFHRRLLGMIINAPGCQQALPRIIKKTRITPGGLLRKENVLPFIALFFLLRCHIKLFSLPRAPVFKSSREAYKAILCQYSCEQEVSAIMF